MVTDEFRPPWKHGCAFFCPTRVPHDSVESSAAGGGGRIRSRAAGAGAVVPDLLVSPLLLRAAAWTSAGGGAGFDASVLREAFGKKANRPGRSGTGALPHVSAEIAREFSSH